MAKITINLNKAIAIKTKQLEEVRDIELKKQNDELLDALESGDTNKLNQIKAKRQKLKDYDKHTKLKNCKNVADLSKLKLEDLT